MSAAVFFAILIAACLLRERIGARRWAAAGLILAGLALMRLQRAFPHLFAAADSRRRQADLGSGRC